MAMSINTYMHEYHSCNEAETLTVASVSVSHCIRKENVVEGLLARMPQAAGEVRVGGKRPSWGGGGGEVLDYH